MTAALPNELDPDSARVPPLTVTAPVFVFMPVSVNVPVPTLVRPKDAAPPSRKVPSNSELELSVPTISVAGVDALVFCTVGPVVLVTWPELMLIRLATVTLLPFSLISPATSNVNDPELMALLLAALIDPDVINVEA